MPLPPPPTSPHAGERLVLRAWAGLECGVWAGALILAWYALHSASRGEFWWVKFNLAAAPFFGQSVFHSGLSRTTAAGAALLIVFYALCGAGFALLVRPATLRPRLLAPALYTVLVHGAVTMSLTPALGPFARHWFTTLAVAVAHLLLFLALVFYPLVWWRLELGWRSLTPLAAQPPSGLAGCVEDAGTKPLAGRTGEQTGLQDPPPG